MPGPVPERQAAGHARAVGQADLENSGEDDLRRQACLQTSDEVGSTHAGFAWIAVLLALASRDQAIFSHEALHPMLAQVQQDCPLAMAQRIIQFVSLLAGDSHLLVLDGLL